MIANTVEQLPAVIRFSLVIGARIIHGKFFLIVTKHKHHYTQVKLVIVDLIYSFDLNVTYTNIWFNYGMCM